MSDQSGTHSYYDWQLSTLLLAYDAIEPLPRTDISGFQKRQEKCEREVRQIAMSVIPEDYHRDPEKELPPDLIVQMTRATLRRAAHIVGVLDPAGHSEPR